MSKGNVMTSCNIALNAAMNLKEQPNSLYVHGSVIIYSGARTVTLEKADPQGTNETILLLQLTVIEERGPMKGVPHPFAYTERGDHVSAYKEVQVVSNLGGGCTVPVEILG
jgi:hypothetical protein